MAQNNESLPLNTPAMEYCIEQIKQSGKPGSEVVIGAMALWVAAHGDFELPLTPSNPNEHVATSLDKMPEITTLTAQAWEFADTQNPSSTEMLNQLDAVENQLDATPELNHRLQEQLLPLVEAAKRKIPESSKDKRHWWRSLKNKNRHRWNAEQIIGNRSFSYNFDLEYKSTKTTKELSRLKVTMNNGDISEYEFKNDLIFNIEFKDDSISSFTISDNSEGDGSQNMLRSLLTKPLKLYEPYEGQDEVVDWDIDILGGAIDGNYAHNRRHFDKHTITLDPTEVNFISTSGISRDDTYRVIRSFDPNPDSKTGERVFRTSISKLKLGPYKKWQEDSIAISERTFHAKEMENLLSAFVSLLPLRNPFESV